MVDDDDPLGQSLDIGHVVTGQEHGRAVAGGIFGDERANPALRRDVQPQRRLVQKEDPRPVQERPGQLALHPLAERKIAYRLGQSGPRSSNSLNSSRVRRNSALGCDR